MAKHDNDPGTIDAFDNVLARIKKGGELDKEIKRREYLRQKKRESRERARKKSRLASTRRSGELAEMTAQVSLTLTVGAKAILAELANDAGTSMSGVVEELLQRHKNARKIRARLPGLFPGG